jgi:hypothetical protein
MTSLIKEDPSAQITWMVYRPGYEARGSEEGTSRISDIESVPEMFARDYKHPIRLVWFDNGQDVINYINNRSRGVKVAGFEYFGHSNRHAFMFDYSNAVMGASREWLHEDELDKIERSAFATGAHCRSFGCHTGESMSQKWHRATGVRMWGVVGKTDYSISNTEAIISPGGYWKF